MTKLSTGQQLIYELCIQSEGLSKILSKEEDLVAGRLERGDKLLGQIVISIGEVGMRQI